ncbi:MAG: hypothetical protein BGO69_11905 [Bacteroidetes bacterium 46-16]|jgi:hypothetical protein|nr:MAG: hypothetical protein BGO69_11905 [Bacteroidetes bacterium 46-16]
MDGQHNKSINDDDFIVPEEGQRDLLCCNKKSLRCPSLSYEYIESEELLNKAYDFLFDELLRDNF